MHSRLNEKKENGLIVNHKIYIQSLICDILEAHWLIKLGVPYDFNVLERFRVTSEQIESVSKL